MCDDTYTSQNDNLQLKLTKVRKETIMEMNQTLKEKTIKFDKERQQLMEKNKELLSKIDQVTGQLEEVQSQCKKQEEELQEFKQNKDLLTQVE